MISPPNPSRSIGVAEPAPALRALLDLPLRHSLDPVFAEGIRDIATNARGASPTSDWAEIYAGAVRLVDDHVAALDRRLEEFQRKSLAAEDPLEARARIAQVPRRDAERVRSDAKAEIQKALREWVDRSKRQQEHVAIGCAPLLRDDRMVVPIQTAHGISVSVDTRWAASFYAFVIQCCDEWIRNYTVGSEESLQNNAREVLAEFGKKVGEFQNPASLSPPSTALVPEAVIGPRDVDIPSIITRMSQSVGRMVTLILPLVGAIGGVAVFGGSDSHGSAGLIGGGVSLLVLVFTTTINTLDGRRQQVVARERGIATYRDAAVAQLRTELDKVLDRHRRALERWTTQRADQWNAAIDQWWAQRVEPHLAAADAHATEVARELKFQQSRLQEEIGNLRSFRNLLSQTILFELKKRRRELIEASTPSP